MVKPKATIWPTPSLITDIISRFSVTESFEEEKKLSDLSEDSNPYSLDVERNRQYISSYGPTEQQEPTINIHIPIIEVNLLKGDHLSKCFCLAVISECVKKFNVLCRIFVDEVGLVKPRDILYKPICDRFTLRHEDSFGKYVINSIYTDKHKFVKDIRTLIYLLEEVRQEIIMFGGITSLPVYVDAVGKMDFEDEEMYQNICEKQEKLKNLKIAYWNCRKEQEQKRNAIDTCIRQSREGIQKILEKTRSESRYTQNWEQARREQNSLTLKASEQYHKNIIRDMRNNMKEETRCHETMETFLNLSTAEYSDQIETWVKKYNKDIEDKELDIACIRYRLEQVRENTEKLQEKFQARENEMKLNHEKLAAATKIQAWWRIILSARQSRPSLKNKDKGKNKDKKKVKTPKGRRNS